MTKELAYVTHDKTTTLAVLKIVVIYQNKHTL